MRTHTQMTPQTPVYQFVEDNPGRAALLEELGIDYCCGGMQPFDQACQKKGIDADKLFARMMAFAPPASTTGMDPVSPATPTEWVHHIEKTHHVYLKAAMPRVLQLIEKVVAAHGNTHPELKDLEATFTELVQDLGPHLIKEERVLFPMIRKLDSAVASRDSLRESIRRPIQIMLKEHDLAGVLLAQIKEITHDYTPPADACRSYKLMLEELHRFSLDTHLHVHKENHLLFPLVLEQLEATPGCLPTPVQ